MTERPGSPGCEPGLSQPATYVVPPPDDAGVHQPVTYVVPRQWQDAAAPPPPDVVRHGPGVPVVGAVAATGAESVWRKARATAAGPRRSRWTCSARALGRLRRR